jgi:L-alanine-DL-glutamate epimerase-like enolase superfamily enzyme
VRHVCLVRIETDDGIIGWSDVETQPHVAHAICNVPSGGPLVLNRCALP